MSNSVNNSCFWNVLFYLLRLEHASHLSPGQIQRIFCHERPTTPYLWDNNLKCSRLKHEGLMTHDYLLINDKYLDHLQKDDLWTALRRRHSRMTIIFFLKWRTPPPLPPAPPPPDNVSCTQTSHRETCQRARHGRTDAAHHVLALGQTLSQLRIVNVFPEKIKGEIRGCLRLMK